MNLPIITGHGDRTNLSGYQVTPRERESFQYGYVRVRKPYCLDCGGIPMYTTYIRKRAGGRKLYPIGYYCQYCEGFLLTSEWISILYGKEDSEYWSWSFSDQRLFPFMEYLEFHQYMLRKLEQRLILAEEINNIRLITWYSRRIGGLQHKIKKLKEKETKKF